MKNDSGHTIDYPLANLESTASRIDLLTLVAQKLQMHNSDIKLGYKFSFGAKKSSGISALENDDHWGYLLDEAKQHIGWHSTRGTGKVPGWKVYLHDLS